MSTIRLNCISRTMAESGRWDTYTKTEGITFILTDRQEHQLRLRPPHEEVVTTMAIEVVRFYRKRLLNLYKIRTKFRDELPQWQFHHFLEAADCRSMEVEIGSLAGVNILILFPHIWRIGFSKGFNSGRHFLPKSGNNEP